MVAAAVADSVAAAAASAAAVAALVAAVAALVAEEHPVAGDQGEQGSKDGQGSPDRQGGRDHQGRPAGITTSRLKRLWRHSWASEREARRVFDAAAFERIESAISEGERLHRAEIRFAVEAELDIYRIWASMTPRERALQVFAEQGVWDTEDNTGVLIYLLWADHAVEIVADRAADRVLPAARWQEICAEVTQACRDGRHVDGVVAAVATLNQALHAALPSTARNPDELSNRSIVL